MASTVRARALGAVARFALDRVAAVRDRVPAARFVFRRRLGWVVKLYVVPTLDRVTVRADRAQTRGGRAVRWLLQLVKRVGLSMGLSELQQVWEDWARADPLWAVLSDPAKSQGRWDPEQFFSTGRDEIRSVMADLAERGIAIKRDRCLDFGCGVGRLTQALAEFFDRCEGVDISPTMIRKAREFNRYPDRCIYRINDKPDLRIFPDKAFDFIYSNIVLQHIEPELSEGYVREFVRLLREDGVALFQVPSTFAGDPHDTKLPEGSHRAFFRVAGEVPTLTAGLRSPLDVEIRNESATTWPLGSNVRVGNHWRTGDGETLLALDDGRRGLSDDLQPGESAVIDLIIEAPATAGSYVLELDLVEEGVCWFAERGSRTLRVPVRVSPPSMKRRPVLAKGRSHADDGPNITPRLFEMHGLHQDRVVAAVTDSGGRLLHIENYNPAGEGWESYRYYVTKATAAGSPVS